MAVVTLRSGKVAALRALKAAGGFQAVMNSRWRRRRLLILCYHGVSLHDEHEWNPTLYIAPAALRARLRLLQALGCSVLPLDDAVKCLYANQLPSRSVVLTFDDGYVDFERQAYPLLQEFGMPATVYLPTLLCGANRPVFRLAIAYMLWKARARHVDLSGLTADRPGRYNLSTRDGRERAGEAIIATARHDRLSLAEKELFAAAIARQLDVDYEAISAAGMLTIMPPASARALAASGVSFELHTHSHRTIENGAQLALELRTNRAALHRITETSPRHFCYPSGWYRGEFVRVLRGADVRSATTCDPGLADPTSDPLVLPRFVDSQAISLLEFEGWVTGAARLLSRSRSYGSG
jgi:peptidoglycan/xylan/chitin deacetylase (PgdA/CDA1 family)